jgi:hypothetical protein
MTYLEGKIEEAKKRIKELQLLIENWTKQNDNKK